MAEALTLAAIIDKLFRTVRRASGKEHSMEEVARWCADWLRRRGEGGTFSKEYVRQLRSGVKTNPTKRHLESLAAFFEVDPAIFFDSERSAEIQADLDLAVAIRDAGVSALALRAVSLTPDDRQKVLELMQSLQNDKDQQ